MKRKTKDFANVLMKNPKISATQAYIDTHETNHKPTARVNASVLLAKPEVQIYMESHVKEAKETVVKMMKSRKDEIRLKASDSILDRVYGKPLTRTNTVNLNISLEDAINSLE